MKLWKSSQASNKGVSYVNKFNYVKSDIIYLYMIPLLFIYIVCEMNALTNVE